MIAVLVLDKTRRINKPVLEMKIPVGFDILCMYQSDHLFYTTAQQIIQFRIRAGGIEKADFAEFPFIIIIGMKARIKPCMEFGGEKQ